MLVKRLTPSAVLPIRGSPDAAGFDLAASEPAIAPAGGKAIVKTGLSMAIPAGTYARVAPRSGLAAKKMINVGAGVVDYDYRGEVCVVIFNHGPEDFAISVGDRVAQLVLERVSMAGCVEVEELDITQRGAGGFGSTGIAQVPAPVQGELLESPGKAAKLEADEAPGEVAALRAEVAELRAAMAEVHDMRAAMQRLQAAARGDCQ